MALTYFTPVTGFAGGILIGLSAAILLLLSGDILGASGLVSSTILSPRRALSDPSQAWKLAFLSTFLLLSNVVLGMYFTNDTRLGKDPSIPVVSVYGYLLGGAFVGFGTRLGNGCTTGHGICGMARLSPRSIAAVCTFMLSAFCTAMLTAPDNEATANVTSFLRTEEVPEFFNRWFGFGISMAVFLPTLYALYNLFRTDCGDQEKPSDEVGTVGIEGSESNIFKSARSEFQGDSVAPAVKMEGDLEHQLARAEQDRKQEEQEKESQAENISLGRKKVIPAVVASAVFAVGLAVSGMVFPSKVLGFLNLLLFRHPSSYDPTLLTVMIAGCIISFLSYQFVKPFGLIQNPQSLECPLVAKEFSIPTNKTIDAELIGGAMCFGIGWGIAGLCPGPAIFLAATGTFPVICCWWPAFLAGSFVAQLMKKR